MSFIAGSLKNNLNVRLQTEHVTVGADATVYVWFLCQIHVSKSQSWLEQM